MLGNGAGSNTSMHGVEELSEPPYLFNREKPVEYTLKIGILQFHKGINRVRFAILNFFKMT